MASLVVWDWRIQNKGKIMNLKDRRKARRLLKELGCLTEFKLELKRQGYKKQTFKDISNKLGGAFDFSSSRRGCKYWGTKIMNNIEEPFGWKYE